MRIFDLLLTSVSDAGISPSDAAEVITDAAAGSTGGFLSGTDMPLWAFFMMPQTWWLTFPMILVIGCAAAILSLRLIDEVWMWKELLVRSSLRMFLVHSGAMIIASGFILFWGFVPAYFSEWWDANVFIHICSNPFGSIFAIIFVLLAIALAFVGMYFLDFRFSFAKHKLEEEKLRKLALFTALFSAPYIFLIPITVQF